MRGPRSGARPGTGLLSLLRRVLVRPLQLILPVSYLLPQRPHHELPPTEIPHLCRGDPLLLTRSEYLIFGTLTLCVSQPWTCLGGAALSISKYQKSMELKSGGAAQHL